jgi:SAM-dependent methyltransferase
VGPEHIAAARRALEGSKPGDKRIAVESARENGGDRPEVVPPEPWKDARGRALFPLEFPDLLIERGVFAPTQGSLLVWKHLYREGIGARQRCLDVGCGSGLQAVQLARNGATHVHAIDIEEAAVSATLTNAFRNGVAGRVSAATVDLFPWVPEERYDVIVASLYQLPVDPFEQVSTHRPLDYWGRNLLDHMISLLPEALAEDGTAYVLQLSIIGQERTVEQLERRGYRSRVVDFGFFEFRELFSEKSDQIERVEELSDAYHLRLGGDDDIIVAYLLEISAAGPEPP